jgi:hypothetical protein
VGGIEIRPVTAAEVQELASGRCTCGCEVDGPPHGLTPDGRRLPVGAPSDAGEGVFDFAANIDGPWAPSWPAFMREMDRLATAERAVRQAGDPGDADMPARHVFTMGLVTAMRWTLAVTTKPPFWSGPPVLVSNAIVESVRSGAAHLAAGSRGEVRWYAEGVRDWLRWITGGIPQIVYPPPP